MEIIIIIAILLIVFAIGVTIHYTVCSECKGEHKDKRYLELRIGEIEARSKIEIMSELVEEYDKLCEDRDESRTEEVYEHAYRMSKVRRAEILRYFTETVIEDDTTAMEVIRVYLEHVRDNKESE